jgi:hypothetical protein
MARPIALALKALLALASPLPALAEEGASTVVEERFETARPVPVIATYDRITPALADRIETGGRWHVILNGSRVAATAEVAGGEAVLRLVQTGKQWYSVQLVYLPVNIRRSMDYRVTFRARADRPVKTTFELCTVSPSWPTFSGKRLLDLGPEWREFEVLFRTAGNERDPSARLELNFGDVEPSEVRVDDVRVVETPVAEAGK